MQPYIAHIRVLLLLQNVWMSGHIALKNDPYSDRHHAIPSCGRAKNERLGGQELDQPQTHDLLDRNRLIGTWTSRRVPLFIALIPVAIRFHASLFAHAWHFTLRVMPRSVCTLLHHSINIVNLQDPIARNTLQRQVLSPCRVDTTLEK